MDELRYVGLDVHEDSISMTIADEGRDGDVHFIGAFPNTPADIAKMAKPLVTDGHRLDFWYEAGGCGMASIVN